MLLLKLLYFGLFLSLEVLLYLRLVRKIDKAGFWLAVALGIWLIALIVHLPIFHIVPFARLKGFLMLSGMMAQLLLIYFFGRLALLGVVRLKVSDEIKNNINHMVSFATGTLVFGIYFFVYLVIFLITLQSQ